MTCIKGDVKDKMQFGVVVHFNFIEFFALQPSALITKIAF